MLELDFIRITPEMTNLVRDLDDQELLDFAETQDDPEKDEAVELFLYVNLELYMRSGLSERLDIVMRGTREWLAVTEDHPDSEYRHQVRDVISIMKSANQFSKLESHLQEMHLPMPQDLHTLRTIYLSLKGTVATCLKNSWVVTSKLLPLCLDMIEIASNYIEGSDVSAVEQARLKASTAKALDDHIWLLLVLSLKMTELTEEHYRVEGADTAIYLAERALELLPDSNKVRQAEVRLTVASTFSSKYKLTGSGDDLDRAIELMTATMKEIPLDDPAFTENALFMGNFGNQLTRRYDCSGSRQDLDLAIQAYSIAAKEGHSSHLGMLGACLLKRYRLAGSIDDLNRGLDAAEEAANLTPEDSEERGLMLANYGAGLALRYFRTHELRYLDLSVEIISQAVEAFPDDHPERAKLLESKAERLGHRFEVTQVRSDLDESIKAAQAAIAATPNGHPRRAYSLKTYSDQLVARFRLDGSSNEADITSAIKASIDALDLLPSSSPDRATSLHNLSGYLAARAKISRSVEDIEAVIAYNIEACCCDGASPFVRITVNRHTAGALTFLGWWDAAHTLLQVATNLLPSLAPRTLAHTDKQYQLGSVESLGPDAAAVALNVGEPHIEAIKLLELGRGVIAGSLVEMRGDVSILYREHPDLASRFVALRDALELVPTDSPKSAYRNEAPGPNVVRDPTWHNAHGLHTVAKTLLESASTATPLWESEARRRYEAENEFNDLLTKIRSQHGLSNFLRPPGEDQLQAAAKDGPIAMINVSRYRCDAFLIERDRLRVLSLAEFGLTMKELKKHLEVIRSGRLSSSSAEFWASLEWIWDAIAQPCLASLGFNEPISDSESAVWPRMWWIPTGQLSHLPLHAAGRYTSSASGDTVLDRVMSSYALSIKTLLFGREQGSSVHKATSQNKALLVAMEKTPDLTVNPNLPFAHKEVNMLRAMTPDLHLDPIKPDPRKADILHHLPSCSLFHFAGHGRSDLLEPSESCLLLDDWKDSPLTVGDLRDCKFQDNPPFLAFLSACSTGANALDKLDDEGVNLVSAFQLAGFRNVIGTLWEVRDEQSVDIVKIFYETIRDEGMSDISVCRGLHRAIRSLRDRQMRRGRTRDESGLAEEEGQSSSDVVVAPDNDGMAEAIRDERDPIRASRKNKPDLAWIPYICFGV